MRPNYGDPRVHAAVNCASIGCPALRSDAFTVAKLDAQLDDGMLRFMGDRTRNRVKGGVLEVSSIFKWFREDFEKGQRGFNKVEDVFAKYAAQLERVSQTLTGRIRELAERYATPLPQLTDDAGEQGRLKAKTVAVNHLDYDWSLNAVGR